ncbi:hypothetical protein ACFOEZ_05265 [Tianweitania populi]|uniref:Lipoprotein n=1 Tax=Tianweitania populi TaxID=1607949 RepID=A0A8J3DUP5_9HYPH|nr:hypothetical protein [Tianweitania populi]GHD08832.1 hypothetical protein GCM10016234_08800 [Tianweitania populi]
MRKGIWMMLGLTLVAAGCQTITPEERRARDEAECRSYGFTKRNDAFAECLQRLELDRRDARREALRYDPWPMIYPGGFVVYR